MEGSVHITDICDVWANKPLRRYKRGDFVRACVLESVSIDTHTHKHTVRLSLRPSQVGKRVGEGNTKATKETTETTETIETTRKNNMAESKSDANTNTRMHILKKRESEKEIHSFKDIQNNQVFNGYVHKTGPKGCFVWLRYVCMCVCYMCLYVCMYAYSCSFICVYVCMCVCV